MLIKLSHMLSERLTRSKKSKQLTNGLEDPAQVEKELNEQLKCMGLYAADTVGDGNCLFRLVFARFRRVSIPFRLTFYACPQCSVRPDVWVPGTPHEHSERGVSG